MRALGRLLEPAVADAARRVLETGVPVIINYDLADDSLWGLAIGCSGEVDIRIERVECAMQVEIAGARHTAEVDGVTYYFCCAGCRAAFMKQPQQFLSQPS